MTSSSSGIRELQIARSLITMRWASIPLIFGFSLLSLKVLGMSFTIGPIYILCCILAVMNVFFTLHFSFLSRQMMLNHGLKSLKHLLIKIISAFFADIKEKKVSAFTRIPATISKIVAVLYLMLLEALSDISFNPFAINNVMHTQVITDILVIALMTRYTGTTESPIFFLSVIPITVAGAVMGLKTGAIYSAISTGIWAFMGILIKFKFIPHVKFYSPAYGDLSQCSGWITSNSLTMATGLFATAFLAHKLTAVFKERIFFLNSLLYKSNTSAIASSLAAENASGAWLILDAEANVEKIKVDRNGVFPADLAGKNLFKAFPELEQYGIGYLFQAVLTSCSRRTLDKIKLKSTEGTEHLFHARLCNFKDCDEKTKILAFFEEKTEEIFLKTNLESTRKELIETNDTLEKVVLENRSNIRFLEESRQNANEKTVELEILSQKFKTLNDISNTQENKISGLTEELAIIKSNNDQLKAELEYKTTLLGELSEVMNACDEIDELSHLIEKKSREMFNLDNACLHIFKSENCKKRKGEILDIRNASPRLLDIPRSNPEALNPVLNEGRPVIIDARITPDKSASMAITNGGVKRLIAYVPVRSNDNVIGMMMLERYGDDANPELLVNMLSYFLKHCTAAIKTAISTRNAKNQIEQLRQKISAANTQLSNIRNMVYSKPTEEERPFTNMLKEFARIASLKDAVIMRFHNDDTTEICSRVDSLRSLELNSAEKEILQTIMINPKVKATVKLEANDDTCTGYPLMHNKRLLGLVFTHFDDEHEIPDEGIMDFCVKLLRDQLALLVMNEEKELWESFYQENLSA